MGELSRGAAVLWVLVLVAAMGGALTWNFRRMEEFRPFRGYSDEQIQELRPVYEKQLAELEGRYQDLAEARPEVQSHALLAENLREFERIQAISENTRKAGHEASFTLTGRRDLEREIYIRENRLQHFFDTATRF